MMKKYIYGTHYTRSAQTTYLRSLISNSVIFKVPFTTFRFNFTFSGSFVRRGKHYDAVCG